MQVLPPLLEWDNSRLCVSLPLLAVVLAGWNAPEPLSSPATSEGEVCIVAPPSWSGDASPYLLDYAMKIYREARLRSAVSSCFFFVNPQQL